MNQSHENPLVSILLPTYNRKDSIKSILFPSIENQTYDNWELIIIDDCSSDETEDYLLWEDLKLDFPRIAERIKYYKNRQNLWSPSSRNEWFIKSSWEWIFMVEDDLQINDSLFLDKFVEYQSLLNKLDKDIWVICPKRIESSKWYYKNYNNQFINYGFLSWEIYLDPNQSYSWYIPNAQACSFIKKEIVDRVQYDTVNYNYFREESDFYERVKQLWYKLYYLWDFLITYHRMDLVQWWGNRKHSVSIKNEIKYWKSHYIFLQKYFSLPIIRSMVYVLLRWFKHISTFTKINFIKDILSLIRL